MGVAAVGGMETFGKAWPWPSRGSATVTRMLARRQGSLRPPARRSSVCCLAAGGVSSLLAAARARSERRPRRPRRSSTSPAASVLVLRGHGWGHGLGLSQWGAYGYAKHGWTYDRILAHYYPGTTLGPAKVTTVRVLLAQAKKATLDSVVAWTVTDAAGRKVALDPGHARPEAEARARRASRAAAAAHVPSEAAARRRRQAVPRQDRASQRRQDAPGDRHRSGSRRI